MIKDFDWNIAEQIHGKEMIALFRDLYETHMSESNFVARYVKIPKKEGHSKRGSRSPSTARNSYKRLKDKYGF